MNLAVENEMGVTDDFAGTNIKQNRIQFQIEMPTKLQ